MNIRVATTALCLALCGAGLISAPRAGAAVNLHHSYTGRQLFEGIVLGQGAVASMFPEYLPVNGERRSISDLQRSASVSALESAILTHDNDFFVTFKRDVTSGDPGIVSRAIRRASREALLAGHMRYPVSTVSVAGNISTAVAVGITIQDSTNLEYDLVQPPVNLLMANSYAGAVAARLATVRS